MSIPRHKPLRRAGRKRGIAGFGREEGQLSGRLDELARRLDRLDGALAALLKFEAWRVINPGFDPRSLNPALAGVDLTRLWRDYDFRAAQRPMVDLLTDEIVHLVWHDQSLSVSEALNVLSANHEMTVGKRAYCLSRVIIYWTANQFFAPDFDILSQIDRFERTEGAWRGFEFTWAEIIGWLAEHGHEDRAAEILKKHRRLSDLRFLDEYLPAAHFAHRQGLSNERIKRSHDLYAFFLRSQTDDLWSELFGAGSIALVGNGPAEKGRRKGREIDGHDLVIRFNDFKLRGHEEDYGRRADVWATNYNITARPESYGSIRRIVAMLSPWEHRYQPALVDSLLSVSGRGRKRLMCFSREARLFCCAEYPEIRKPSSGFEWLAALKRRRPDFRTEDVYGFSFKEGVKDAHHFDHYYTLTDDRSTIHDFKREELFIRRLFGLGGTSRA